VNAVAPWAPSSPARFRPTVPTGRSGCCRQTRPGRLTDLGQDDRGTRGMVATARRELARVIGDRAWAQWAAQLAPVVAIEAVMAWLDAGQPDPTGPPTASARPWPASSPLPSSPDIPRDASPRSGRVRLGGLFRLPALPPVWCVCMGSSCLAQAAVGRYEGADRSRWTASANRPGSVTAKLCPKQASRGRSAARRAAERRLCSSSQDSAAGASTSRGRLGCRPKLATTSPQTSTRSRARQNASGPGECPVPPAPQTLPPPPPPLGCG
jgi:hypothetical protein